MQTFIKKLSRGSEFAVVIPADVKRKYELEVNQIVSFEVYRRDNGVVVLYSKAVISDLDADTEIVFSVLDLDPRTNDGIFTDETVYGYRIVVYSAIDHSELNIITDFFDKVQMLTENIFLIGDDNLIGNKLSLYYNGGFYTTNDYPLGASQLRYYFEFNKNFIVPDENLDPENVVCEGFDPVIVEGDFGRRLAFSTSNGSSDIMVYSSDSSSEYFYIPSEYLSSLSSQNGGLNFNMMRASNWKYGVKFRYFTTEAEEILQKGVLGIQANFENLDSVSVSELTGEYCLDYFDGVNVPMGGGSYTGWCNTFGEVVDKFGSTGNGEFGFFSKSFYKYSVLAGFIFRGFEHDGEYYPITANTSVIVNLGIGVKDQIVYINNNIREENLRIAPGDILHFDVMLSEKSVNVKIAVNVIENPISDELSSSLNSSGYCNVILTEYGKRRPFETEFQVGYYSGKDISDELFGYGIPKFVSTDFQVPIGFTISREVLESSWGMENLNEFRAEVDENYYYYQFDGMNSYGSSEAPLTELGAQTFLQNPILSYDTLLSGMNAQAPSGSSVEYLEEVTLYPVFFSGNPFELEFVVDSSSVHDTFKPVKIQSNVVSGVFTVTLNPDYEINTFGAGTIDEVSDDFSEENDELSSDEMGASDSSSIEDEGTEFLVKYRLFGTQYYGDGELPATGSQEIGYENPGVYLARFSAAIPLLGVLNTSAFARNWLTIRFITWGSVLNSADNIFSGVEKSAVFEVPEWGDNIISANYTYFDSEVHGNVPEWNNIESANGTFGLSNVEGIIPAWGKVKSAKSTYVECKRLYGIWDFAAPFEEIMPSYIEHDANTVKGVSSGVRALFRNDWGGSFDFFRTLPGTSAAGVSGEAVVIASVKQYHSGNLEYGAGIFLNCIASSFTIHDNISFPGGAHTVDGSRYSVGNLIGPNCVAIQLNMWYEPALCYAGGEPIFSSPEFKLVIDGSGVEAEAVISTPSIQRYRNDDHSSWKVPDTIKRVVFTHGWVVPQECFKNYALLRRVEYVGGFDLALEDGCFSGCSSLEYVKLQISSIGPMSFANCKLLKNLVIENHFDSFGVNCFLNVGADIVVNLEDCIEHSIEYADSSSSGEEVCITTLIELPGFTRPEIRNKSEFIRNGFGAGANVCLRCSDGDIRMVNGTWNCEFLRLELVSEPAEIVYEVVDFSSERFRIPRDNGLHIDAIYSCNGSIIRENVTNNVSITDVTVNTVDSCVASLTVAGTTHTVNIPVEVRHVDITEVLSKCSFVSCQSSLKNREFTAFEYERNNQISGMSIYHYGILVTKRNVRWSIKYAITHDNGLSGTFVLYGEKREYEGHRLDGPRLVGDIATQGMQRFRIWPYKPYYYRGVIPGTRFQKDVQGDRLFGCGCVLDESNGISGLAWDRPGREPTSFYTQYSVDVGEVYSVSLHIDYGDFLYGRGGYGNDVVKLNETDRDTVYGRLDIGRLDMVSVSIDTGLSNNSIVSSGCGSLKVWMPFRVSWILNSPGSIVSPHTLLDAASTTVRPATEMYATVSIPSVYNCTLHLGGDQVPLKSAMVPIGEGYNGLISPGTYSSGASTSIGLEFKNSYFPDFPTGHERCRTTNCIYLGQYMLSGGAAASDTGYPYRVRISPGSISADDIIKTFLYLYKNRYDKLYMGQMTSIQTSATMFFLIKGTQICGAFRQTIPITVFVNGLGWNSAAFAISEQGKIQNLVLGYCGKELIVKTPYTICSDFEEIVPEMKLELWDGDTEVFEPDWTNVVRKIVAEVEFNEQPILMETESGTEFLVKGSSDEPVGSVGVYDVVNDSVARENMFAEVGTGEFKATYSDSEGSSSVLRLGLEEMPIKRDGMVDEWIHTAPSPYAPPNANIKFNSPRIRLGAGACESYARDLRDSKVQVRTQIAPGVGYWYQGGVQTTILGNMRKCANIVK